MMKSHSNKHFSSKFSQTAAFTLVELSIVVVIIAVLAGGIVSGTGLIDSFKRGRIISEIEMLNKITLAFKSKYGKLPGDLDTAYDYWPTTCYNASTACNGDGNGYVGRNSSAASGCSTSPSLNYTCWSVSGREFLGFWNHLYLAGFVKYGWNTTNTSNFWLKSDSNISAMAGHKRPLSGYYYTDSSFKIKDRHAFYIWNGPNTAAWGGSWQEAGLTTENVQKIDQKIDNGVAKNGTILSAGDNSDSPCTFNNSTSAKCTMLWYQSF